MKAIKPMRKIMIVLSSFGILMGIIFPIYADFFIECVPKKRMPFNIGCVIAGFLVGMFGYIIIKSILKRIDKYYKKTLFNKLNLTQFNNEFKNKDLILSMQEEFEELVNRFDEMKKNEEKRLKELSITDCLTSLYNHRYFYEYMQEKLANNSQQTSLLFCDIDHFKFINDTYGHIVGDCILTKVARSIKNEVKESDGVFRYGGEEFIVILENHSVEQAYEMAEQIRLNIYSSNLLNKYGKNVSLSISIGIASYPYHAMDVKALLEKADKAMYFAKQSGRNQCKIYNQELDKLLKYNSIEK